MAAWDLFGDLTLGLATAVSVQNLLYCFVGVLLGTLIGVLPGIGPVATIAMLLPVTYALPPTMHVTTEEASPGRLTRIAVVEPPYWAP